MLDLVVTHWFRVVSALIGGPAGLKAAEDARRVAEARVAEDARRVAEAKAAGDARRAAEAKAVEDARRAAEAKAVEDARRAAEAKAVEDARRAAEAKAAKYARIAAATHPGRRPEGMAAPPAGKADNLKLTKGIPSLARSPRRAGRTSRRRNSLRSCPVQERTAIQWAKPRGAVPHFAHAIRGPNARHGHIIRPRGCADEAHFTNRASLSAISLASSCSCSAAPTMAPPGAGPVHHINRRRQYNLLNPRRGIMMRLTQSYHTRALVPTPPPAPPAGPSKLNISNNNNLLNVSGAHRRRGAAPSRSSATPARRGGGRSGSIRRLNVESRSN
jgi:hypothetical protein